MRYLALLALCLMQGVALAQKQISIEDIYSGVFRQESLGSLNWMNDGRYYTALVNNQVVKYDVTTGNQVEVLIDGQAQDIRINDYEFSADEKKILLLTDKKGIYRRSFTAEYYIYDFGTKKLQKVSDNGRQSYVTFSPDNSKVAFVRDNNLYYTDLKTMKELAVTTDGEPGKIINGSSDWVYEEELRLTKAFVWSTDGKKLAFLRFDESEVKEYNLQYWDNGAKYPRDYRYKYPKAGEKNAVVSVHLYDLASNNTTTVDLGKDTDFYIPKIQWTKDANLLSVMKLNRLQNKLEVYHVNASTAKPLLIFYEKAEKYLDLYDTNDIIYLDNNEQFIYMTTERDGYKHCYLHNMDGQHIRAITKGEWEVDQFVGLDQSRKTPVLYYTSTEESPLERHFYKIDINGRGKTRLSTASGTNRVDMSKDFKYYIIFNQSAQRPLSVNLMASRGNKLIDTLVNNAKLIETVKAYDIRKKEFFSFETVDGTSLNGYFLKPAAFDSTRQYPVLIYQYSGPGSQNVLDTWEGSSYYWHQMLVQKGYVVAVIDPRGTGGRGEAFKKVTYRQMGKLETTDLIEGAKYIGSLPYFDKNRIGIWGWSYGGYASTVAMMKGQGVFKACISVAPFSWEHYDTIYAERYMQRPEDNPKGYEENSLLTHADKLQGNYLLIHGTGDDNVHYQVALNLVNKLVDEGKQFRSFFYPDKAHGIGGYKTRIHLFTMMTEFLENNL